MRAQAVRETEKAERERSLELLRQWIKPGDSILTANLHTSRSGLEHVVGAWAILPPTEARPRTIRLFGHVARVLGRRADCDRGGVVFRGGGLDARDELVHDLSRALFGDGRQLTNEEL